MRYRTQVGFPRDVIAFPCVCGSVCIDSVVCVGSGVSVGHMVAIMQSNAGGEAEECVEVWSRNLEDSFTAIRNILQRYPYVAMVSGAL